MPKKKKTRQQKMQADVRRKTSSEMPSAPTPSQVMRNAEPIQKPAEMTPGTFSLPEKYLSSKAVKTTKKESLVTVSETDIDTKQYKYLRPDLVKTISLTSIIIVAELVIRHFVT